MALNRQPVKFRGKRGRDQCGRWIAVEQKQTNKCVIFRLKVSLMTTPNRPPTYHSQLIAYVILTNPYSPGSSLIK